MFRQEGTKCNSGGNEANSKMGRKSFSNSFLSIRSFSSRRRANRADKKASNEGNGDGAESGRKFSIDHTVVSGESNNRLNDSLHFRRLASFETIDNTVENVSSPVNSHFVAMTVGEEEQEVVPPASTMRVSKSDPLLSLNYYGPNTGAVCKCQCVDCTSPPPTHLLMEAPQQLQQTAPPPAPIDPALNARIEAVRIQQQLLGENHPDVIFALSSLAKLYQRRGDHREASSILRESQMRSFLAKTVPQQQPQRHPRQYQDDLYCVPTEISFSRENS